MEEQLFVERGRLRVHVGKGAHDLFEGDFLFYPAGVEHTFENVGEEEARLFTGIDSTRLR